MLLLHALVDAVVDRLGLAVGVARADRRSSPCSRGRRAGRARRCRSPCCRPRSRRSSSASSRRLDRAWPSPAGAHAALVEARRRRCSPPPRRGRGSGSAARRRRAGGPARRRRRGGACRRSGCRSAPAQPGEALAGCRRGGRPRARRRRASPAEDAPRARARWAGRAAMSPPTMNVSSSAGRRLMQPSEGIDRVRRPATLDLDARDREALVVRHRAAGTARAGARRPGRPRPPCAAACRPARSADDVEPELGAGLLRADEVREVRRVERPAEQPEPHARTLQPCRALDEVARRSTARAGRSGRGRAASGSSCRSRRPCRTRRRR